MAAAAAKGFSIVYVCIDDGTSAFNGKATARKAVQDMLTVLNEQSDIEAIFFYDESRLDRQYDDFVLNVVKPLRLRRPNIQFHSSNQEAEWNENDVFVQAKLIFSQQESLIKADRARDYRKSLLQPTDKEKSPLRPPAKTPYGYVRDGSYLLVDPIKSEVVNFIFFLSSWGLSNVNIANYLNDCNIKGPTGGTWSSSTIDVILHNLTYLGHYSEETYSSSHWSISRKSDSNKVIIFNVNEPIIPTVYWELVTQMRKFKDAYGNHDTPFILRGLIYCKRCNSLLIARDSTPGGYKKAKYLQYHCNSCKHKVDIDICQKEVLSKLFSDLESGLLESKEYTLTMLKKWSAGLEEVVKTIKSQQSKLEHNNQLVAPAFPYYDQWSESYQLTKNALSDAYSSASYLITRVKKLSSEDALIEIFSRFNQNPSQLSQLEKRTLVLSLIQKVEIDLEKNNRISIIFGKTPFVDLNESVVHFTEKHSYLLAELPHKKKNLFS